MKKITIDINTKWDMLYRKYKMSKGIRKERIRRELFKLLQYNALINQFNHDNQ